MPILMKMFELDGCDWQMANVFKWEDPKITFILKTTYFLSIWQPVMNLNHDSLILEVSGIIETRFAYMQFFYLNEIL